MGDLSKFFFQVDFINLLYLPFILLTLTDVRKNWSSLTDEVLTPADRALLKRATIFLILPSIDLLHELGHCLAALSVGARVVEFHYGFVTGYVKIFQDRTASQLLWIAFAGNLFQILIGLVSFLIVPLVRSPYMVALLVYSGLFAISQTAVFYTMLSAVGAYGDWIEIYTSPDRTGVIAIGIFHAVILLLLAYLCFGHWPRYWFARQTMPGWYELHKEVEATALEDPAYATLEPLCVSWMRAGLPGRADKVLKQMAALGDRPQVKLLQGRILLMRGNVDGAVRCFGQLIADRNLNEKGRARLCVEAGDILMNSRQFAQALNLFSTGVELDPVFAEARLFKAIMLNSIGKHAEALQELSLVSGADMEWAAPENQSLVTGEVERARLAMSGGG